ncbi:MAG: adenosylcobinamide-GDP ribazoletransferase [Firmicutes bacterium]|nr:adenosylcobinamide-GDP ribazoletransferase [Bacillota bacterium]
MRFLEPFCIALTTYSVLPAPQVTWNERNMCISICYLPLIGVIAGAVQWLWFWLCQALQAGPVLFAAVAAVLPVLITGGIHMDGYLDTVDAISSHQTKERKLEILKDSHCGAFAIIYAGVYFLLLFGFFSQIFSWRPAAIVACGYVLSRSLAVILAATTPNARKNGMLAAFTGALAKKVALLIMIVLTLAVTAGMVCISLWTGLICAAVAGVWLLLYRRLAMGLFGGATGDTTGFFIQVCELLLCISASLCSLAFPC